MSTPASPLPNASGDPQAPQPQPQPQPEPAQLQKEYVVEAAGSVFRGKTQQEVIDAMKKSIEHGNRRIAELGQQQKQPQPEQPKFDNQRYYELLASDPVAAQDYLDEIRYGISRSEIVSRVNTSYEASLGVQNRYTVSQWQAEHPEYPASDPAAGDAFDQVYFSLFTDGAPATIDRMNAAHAVCLNRGLYRPAQQQVAQQQAAQQPLPTLNATGVGAGGGFNPTALSTDKLEEYIRSQNSR